jgi:hypothetical protein
VKNYQEAIGLGIAILTAIALFRFRASRNSSSISVFWHYLLFSLLRSILSFVIPQNTNFYGIFWMVTELAELLFYVLIMNACFEHSIARYPILRRPAFIFSRFVFPALMLVRLVVMWYQSPPSQEPLNPILLIVSFESFFLTTFLIVLAAQLAFFVLFPVSLPLTVQRVTSTFCLFIAFKAASQLLMVNSDLFSDPSISLILMGLSALYLLILIVLVPPDQLKVQSEQWDEAQARKLLDRMGALQERLRE